jgi:hypothetical protein
MLARHGRVAGDQDHQATEGSDGTHAQHLGRDKQLSHHHHPEQDAVAHQVTAADDHLVEQGQDERREGQEHQEVVGLGLAYDVGGEAVEEPPGKGRRPPAHPAAEHEVHGYSRQGEAQPHDQVEGGRRPEEPGDRSESDPEQRRTGVAHQVDAVRIVDRGRNEGVETVSYGVRRPRLEPGLKCEIAARARREEALRDR